MTEPCVCWKCGAALPELLLPVPRQEECPNCHAQLHVCRMCKFFAATVAQQCREPVAEPVSDKQRANFCGYFQINPHAFGATADTAADSRQQLDALFGGGPSGAAPSGNGTEDAARKQLDELFGK